MPSTRIPLLYNVHPKFILYEWYAIVGTMVEMDKPHVEIEDFVGSFHSNGVVRGEVRVGWGVQGKTRKTKERHVRSFRSKKKKNGKHAMRCCAVSNLC